MPVRRFLRVGVVVCFLCLLAAAPTAAQFEFPLPGGTTPSSGEAIDFGSVSVGQTARARYTFKVLESSDTSASVTITPPGAPFGLADLPSLSFTLAPGQSITFTVTLAPPQARDYTGQLTITASGGYPVQVRKTTVSLRGRGVAPSAPPPPTTPSPTTTAPLPSEVGPSVSGTTDAGGGFNVSLNPTTSVSGKLTQCGKIPLGNQPFTIDQTADGFVVAAPGFQLALVTDYSTFSLFGLKSHDLKTICLLPVPAEELPPTVGRPTVGIEEGKKPDYAFAGTPCVEFAPAGLAPFCYHDRRLYPHGNGTVGTVPKPLPLECSIRVKAKIVNQGEVPTGPPLVRLTVDGVTADLELVASPPSDRVPQYWAVEMILPTKIALAGDRLPSFVASIDPANAVDELSESNNTWTGAAIGAFDLLGGPAITDPTRPGAQPALLAIKPDGTWVVALDKPLSLAAEAALGSPADCPVYTSGMGTGCTTYAPLDLSYRWEFGDGESADGKRTSHAYRTGGTYVLRMVTTLGSASTVTERQVEVTDKPVITDLSQLLHRVFIGGIVVHNAFTAFVEPNGNVLDSVQFVLNGEPRAGRLSGTVAVYTHDMGSLRRWPDGNTLYAIAYAHKPSGEPVVSDPYPVPPLSIPVASIPLWLSWMQPLSAAVAGNAVDYTASFAFPNIPIDVSYTIPSWVPLVSGTYSFNAGSRFSLSLSSLGPGRASGEGSAGFEKSGGDWTFGFSGSADGEATLNIGPPITLAGGAFSVDLNGSASKTFDLCDTFSPLRAACRIPVIGRGVEWLCRRAELGVGLSLGVGGEVSFASADPGCCLRGIDCEGRVRLSGGLQASLTLSVSIASVSVFGGGTLTAVFVAPGDSLGFLDFESLTLAGEVGVTVEVDLWLVSASKTFSFPFECQILSPPQGFATHIEDPWVFPVRPYATPTFSTYRGELRSDEDLGITELWLIEEVFPLAAPRLIHTDPGLAVAWNTDDLSKPFPFGREIAWATGERLAAFSPLELISDNRLPDAQVTFGRDRAGRLLAIWAQHVSPPDAPTSEDDLDSQLLAGLEVVWSSYDSAADRWIEPARLTENAFPDHSPALVGGSDGVLGVVWVGNRRGELFPSDLAPDTVYFAPCSDDGFGPAAILREGDAAVARSFAAVGGALVYVRSEDADGDPTSVGDASLWCETYVGGRPVASERLTDTAGDDVGLDLAAVTPDRAVLLWIREQPDGRRALLARSIGPAGWETEWIVQEEFPASTIVTAAAPNGHVAVVWEGFSAVGPDLFAIVVDPTRRTASDRRQLTADADVESQASAVYDGKVLTVAFVRTMVTNESRTVRYSGPDAEDPSRTYVDRQVEIEVPARGTAHLLLLEAPLP